MTVIVSAWAGFTRLYPDHGLLVFQTGVDQGLLWATQSIGSRSLGEAPSSAVVSSSFCRSTPDPALAARLAKDIQAAHRGRVSTAGPGA
jgi:hypothetical protein